MEKFALLVPLYNPTSSWEETLLDRSIEFVNKVGKDIKIVLINDGSTNDISAGVGFLQKNLDSLFVYHSYPTNKGKGAALKYGASKIEAQNYLFTDIDFPYSLSSMEKVYHQMSNSTGIVIGHRENNYYNDLSWTRSILSKTLRWLNKFLLGLPINDTQCGLKAFDRDVREVLLHCRTDRFLIDLELLLAVNKKKIQITPVNVELRSDINFTKFNSSVLIKEFFSFFVLLWKYRWK